MPDRPYQIEDTEQIIANYQFGLSTQLVVQATGLGKTRMMAKIRYVLERCGLKGKILVIVDRVELAEQTREEFLAEDPTLKIGLEQAENYALQDCDVIIVSVQTVGTAVVDNFGDPVYSDRLRRFTPKDFAAVLVDETHKASVNTFRSVLMYMGAHKGYTKTYRPELLVVGFTATPNRTDDQGMEEFYDVVSANRDIVWGIENNWLTDVKGYRVSTYIDLDKHDIGSHDGRYGADFSKTALQKAIDIPARNELIIQKYIELGEGMSGVFFCVDTQHARNMLLAARKFGLNADIVIGTTGKDKRKQVFSDHKRGALQVLTGCGVFVEGWNNPRAAVACMCRPTKSKRFYIQAIGRVLRHFPSPEALAEMRATGIVPEWIKPYAIVIDFCDLTAKHSVVGLGSVFGMGSKFQFNGKLVKGEAKKFQQELCKLDEKKRQQVDQHEVSDIEELKALIEKVDLLKPPAAAEYTKEYTDIEWVEQKSRHGKRLEIALPGNEVIYIEPTSTGTFDIVRSHNGLLEKVETKYNLKDAVQWAEKECIPIDQRDLLSAEAKWKQKRPSPQQIQYLGNLRKDMMRKFSGNRELFAAWVKQNYSQGQVSLLINECLGKKG